MRARSSAPMSITNQVPLCNFDATPLLTSRRDELTGQADIGTGPLGVIGNLIWLILAGWWLALGHLITAILMAITIIGIPFAWAHLKLAGIALWPIGKVIVPA